MALDKETFFESMEQQGLALTYQDVRLETGLSSVIAKEADLTSKFSREVGLLTPFVSAAMDTVTESNMAIAMAKMGGIGVVHAAMTIAEQRDHVRRVKFSLNGIIESPVVVTPEATIRSVLEEYGDHSFRTFPVVSPDGKLLGLMTQNDFDFCRDHQSTVESQMTPFGEVYTAEEGIEIVEALKIMEAVKKKTLPLLNKEGQLTGLCIFSDISEIVYGNRSTYNLDDNQQLRVAAAVSTDKTMERVEKIQKYADAIVIDTANGGHDFVFNALREVKAAYPELQVVAGNVSSGAAALALAEAGADGIKVGQGPGSICTTRPETGIGTPQVTAVYDCVRALRQNGHPDVPVCADGGIVDRGDVSLAIAAGAASVMMGNMLSATKESPGRILTKPDGSRVKLYRGMGSASALQDNPASLARYGDDGIDVPLPEGVDDVFKPYKGTVAPILKKLDQALRKSMAYVGTHTIAEHQEDTKFVRITNAGLTESRPHDLH